MFTELPRRLDAVLDLKLDKTQIYVACRDKNIYIYDTAIPYTPPAEISLPVVPCCLAPSSQGCLVGCSDGSVRLLDLENFRADEILFQGSGPVNFLRYMNRDGTVLATTVPGEIMVAPLGGEATRYHTSGKIFAADATDDVVVIAMAGGRVQVYHAFDLNRPRDTTELATVHQIECIKCMPDSRGYAFATIDGRVLLEYFGNATASFTFKCHRQVNKTTAVDDVFQVHALTFSDSETLFTGGGDGTVCVWNCSKRKRIRMYPLFTSQGTIVSVAKVAIGAVVAVAVSDDLYLRQEAAGEWQPDYTSAIYIDQD